MTFLAYFLVLLSALFLVAAFASAENGGLFPCFLVSAFTFFVAYSTELKSELYIEKNIVIEVTDYHLYVYKKGKKHEGAWFTSDKAYDVQNAQKVVGIKYKNTWGIFGWSNGEFKDKQLVFQDDLKVE